jgi:LmbE family N-acetylglucosaminyl deacetylase
MASQITTPDDIKQLGTILSVWAHPDDESYTCAGIMAAAIANGQSTACITATKGEAGVQDESRWPADQLGEIRADEMRHALECLGCTHHHWMGYPDGGCADVPEAAAIEQLLTFIDHYQPDTILTWGPEGMTGHADHATVSVWATKAARQSGRDISVYQ